MLEYYIECSECERAIKKGAYSCDECGIGPVCNLCLDYHYCGD